MFFRSYFTTALLMILINITLARIQLFSNPRGLKPRSTPRALNERYTNTTSTSTSADAGLFTTTTTSIPTPIPSFITITTTMTPSSSSSSSSHNTHSPPVSATSSEYTPSTAGTKAGKITVAVPVQLDNLTTTYHSTTTKYETVVTTHYKKPTVGDVNVTVTGTMPVARRAARGRGAN